MDTCCCVDHCVCCHDVVLMYYYYYPGIIRCFLCSNFAHICCVDHTVSDETNCCWLVVLSSGLIGAHDVLHLLFGTLDAIRISHIHCGPPLSAEDIRSCHGGDLHFELIGHNI